MTAPLVFTLDGFALHGTDEFGVVWTTAAAPGWHSAPRQRTDRAAKAQQAGSWDAKGHADERLVVLRGRARAVSAVLLEAAGRRLAAVLADGSAGVLVGSSDYGTLSAVVRVEDAPTFDLLSGVSAEWSVAVAAPDPLLYGAPVYRPASLVGAIPGEGLTYPLAYPLDYGVPAGVTPGAVSLPNAGTAAYWPRLRIDGPVPNPVVTLVETGAWVRYNGTIPGGQWVDFDLVNRRVLLRGQVSVRQLVSSSGNWLAVPPGGGSVTWTADAADPDALLSVWGYEMAVS